MLTAPKMIENVTPLTIKSTKPPHHVLNLPIEDSKFLPPIHKLPIDVIGEIFTRYLKDKGGKFSYRPGLMSSLESQVTPFTLGYVCRHWMNITLSMPTLWSSIFVLEPNMPLVPLVQLWLERASGCPLSLSLYESSGSRENLAIEQVLLLFVEHLHCWQHINFRLSSPRRSLLNLPKGIPYMLETAKLDPGFSLMDSNHFYASNVWRALHSSPALRQAYWTYDYVPSHAPWEQLTDFRIGNVQQDTFLEILRSCQQLVALDVGDLSWPSIMASPSPVTLPALHTLEIRVRSSDPKLFFQSLVLPALVRLRLWQGFDAPRIPCDLDNLLSRSSCQLREFTFYDKALEEEGVANYLALPSLQTLFKLELQARVADVVVEALTITPTCTKPHVLPHLKIIRLFKSCASDGMMSRMVISRLYLLEAFTIFMDEDPCVYDIASLKLLQNLICDICNIIVHY